MTTSSTSIGLTLIVPTRREVLVVTSRRERSRTGSVVDRRRIEQREYFPRTALHRDDLMFGSQRAHREKKERALSTLRDSLESLQTEASALRLENKWLRDAFKEAHKELDILRAAVSLPKSTKSGELLQTPPQTPSSTGSPSRSFVLKIDIDEAGLRNSTNPSISVCRL